MPLELACPGARSHFLDEQTQASNHKCSIVPIVDCLTESTCTMYMYVGQSTSLFSRLFDKNHTNALTYLTSLKMHQVSKVAETSAEDEQLDPTNEDTSGDCIKMLNDSHAM